MFFKNVYEIINFLEEFELDSEKSFLERYFKNLVDVLIRNIFKVRYFLI